MDGGVPAGRNPSEKASAFFIGAARKRLRRSTFQVNTIVVKAAGGSASDRVHACARHVQKWDLVKRRCASIAVRNVIGREKVLIQLESLILAQSERWRQA